tara:strand:+ start:51 stop:1106 length:1056 start_codon:yes stop_codon:yes gene_type:complete
MVANEIKHVREANIKVIGVGGAGCASLARLEELMPRSASLMGIDTGCATENLSAAIASISFGTGFGSGGDPENARLQFDGVESLVREFISGADVLIILAGLGRGTGSGVSPELARLGREVGALTLAAVHMPFEFEGRFRNYSARLAANALRLESDAVISISNDDLSGIIRGGSSSHSAFNIADKTIVSAVNAIVAGFETDVAHATRVLDCLRQAGESVVLSAELTGKYSVENVVSKAFECSKAKFAEVESAMLHVEGGISLSHDQILEIVDQLRNRIGPWSNIHLTSKRLIGMGSDIQITIVLAGVQEMGDPVAELETFVNTDGNPDITQSDLSSNQRSTKQRVLELMPVS